MPVLGMVHEHQRWDRDDYIEFRCHNLRDMEKPVEELQKTGLTEGQAWEILCTNLDTAVQYNAPSAGYIKGDGLDRGTQPQLDGPGGLDIDSIMMYSSDYDSYIKDQVDLNSAVLVGFKKDSNGQKIPGSEFWIPESTKPSPLDASFVRKFYPWDEAKYQEWIKNNPSSKP
jgi:hypothetical protein